MRKVAINDGAVVYPFFAALSLVLACGAWWYANSTWLFGSLDGSLYAFTIKNLAIWGSAGNPTAINPFCGMGSLFLPMNVFISPGFWPFSFLKAESAMYLSYAIFITIYFFAVYSFGRVAGLSQVSAAVSSQLVSVAGFTGFGGILGIYSQFSLNPEVSFVIALQLICLCLYVKLGESGLRYAAVCAIVMMCLIFYSAICDPYWTAVAAISFSPIYGVLLFKGGSLRSVTMRLVFAVVIIIVLYYLNCIDFVANWIRYSAREFFPHEVHGEIQNRSYCALMFRGGSRLIWIFTLALGIGWVASFLASHGRYRAVAGACICHSLLIITLSAVFLYTDINWTYPLPMYLDFLVFPVYIIGAVPGWRKAVGSAISLSETLGKLASDRFYKKWGQNGRMKGSSTNTREIDQAWIPQFLRNSVVISAAALCLVPLIVIAYLTIRSLWRWPPATSQRTHTLNRSSIVETLTKEIGIQLNSTFRGYAASIIGVANSEIAQVLKRDERTPFHKEDLGKIVTYLGDTIGNTHMLTDLWCNNIPTLEEYGQTVSPPLYYVLSRLLCRSIDYQSRNFALVTLPDVRVLQFLGVRFLLTDRLLPGIDASLRHTLQGPQAVTLYLYEFPKPNLGNYSPTRLHRLSTARDAIAKMRQKDFNFETEAIVQEDIDEPLLPATEASITYLKGDIQIDARSPGYSLLALPLQFSRCIDARSHDDFRLVRVNLVSTGILFHSRITLRLRNNFGPFCTSCRSSDLRDLQDLQPWNDGWVRLPPFTHPYAIWNISRWIR